ncbi:MAG: 2-amino-4-hydroxy-6-hydroxymethyldihydropteridine diphosphokinase [Gammaproteobacteria bacterium]|nr:2-amino-4-hydroxy-6-hydroxymethyldihydropteridine diphosphokinase [Gammaproteobacteria bacterium]
MLAEEVHIAIGSNIGDSLTIVSEAIEHLRSLPKTDLQRHSSLYRTEAVSDIQQDDYINAAVLLTTTLEPMDLLLELQAIEQAFYRQRDTAVKWAPRTLDLDIILFGARIIDDSHLTIPHAEMQNRLFVLQPMFEISGDLYISGLGSLKYLVENAPKMMIKQIL